MGTVSLLVVRISWLVVDVTDARPVEEADKQAPAEQAYSFRFVTITAAL
jgi:hypothetical protein